ncbi:hypothetical protein CANARDRAFT_27558 [[Candida] arabinofermentans NRRL YB-2248]|uniref:Hsp70 nucleotide exchange factor FES1 n=1 Tax=[Candida] arabinofermentans NRRL YB-2248 TaxID=983967 RepID=A0A1E4T3K2_9ASCO|nr:hypothetical protein CANARDRAFT_27558 [[Candida] arabinofermentans NRRL YB-2248]
MDKLLKWSIANQTGDAAAKEKAGTPDPELLAQLFGNQADEPTLMKQNLSVILHPEADLDNKLTAFDNFEMLIENLDNANNIQNMGMWGSLLDILDEEESQLVSFACSVIGTAAQNNKDSQDSFLKNAETDEKSENKMGKLIEFASGLSKGQDKQVQLKALYALSNVIRHNEDAYKMFDELNGWGIISGNLKNENDNKLKLRTLSLLNALLSTNVDQEKLTKIHDSKAVKSLLNLIDLKEEDENLNISCIDMSLNLLVTLIRNKYQFDDIEMELIMNDVKSLQNVKDQINEDDLQVLKSVVS